VRELKNVVIRLTTKYAGYTVSEAELESEFAPAADTGRIDPVRLAREELLAGKGFSLDGRCAMWNRPTSTRRSRSPKAT
jgi:hypothetical protein